MAADFQDPIQKQIEGLRQKLLDLTLRNRMLNYKPSKRLSVEIVGEDSGQIFDLLVPGEKKLSLKGIPTASKSRRSVNNLFTPEHPDLTAKYRKAAEEELDTFLDLKDLPASRTDAIGNVQELDDVLETKLRSIERESRLANDELGINTLFLVLGSLIWNEPGERECRAPLIFIPVRLEKLANGSMRVRHDGTDVGSNLPLQAKLAELNLKFPDFDDEKGLGEYFAAVELTVKGRLDWELQPNDISLSFFNYEKYAMYMDLGGDNWPEESKPWHNADIAAMLGSGYGPATSVVDETSQTDQYRAVQDTREVFDADSSQSIALIRAADGISMVVEGPPGTGKSQTITNMIAEAVGAGKTVLFVSAKRAALEVVKRNLIRADLGPICLDLHDRLKNRREFYREIEKTVSSSISVSSEESKVVRLTELRSQLNSFVESVNGEVAPFDVTPFAAMSRLSELPPEGPADREGRIGFESLKAKSVQDFDLIFPLVKSLQDRLGKVGVPVEHPFWGCQIEFTDPAHRLDLEEELQIAQKSFGIAIAAISEAARGFGIEPPVCPGQVPLLGICLSLVKNAPEHLGVAATDSAWDRRAAEVQEIIQNLSLSSKGREKLSNTVRPEIWNRSLDTIRAAFDQNAESWLRFMSGSFRAANRELEQLLVSPASFDSAARRALVHEVMAVQQAEKSIASQETVGGLFGIAWKGIGSDARLVSALADWVANLRGLVKKGQIPDSFLYLFSNPIDLSLLSQNVAAAEAAAIKALNDYSKVANLLGYPCERVSEESFVVLGLQLVRWSDHLKKLPDFIGYSNLAKQVSGLGWGSVLDIADKWKPAGSQLTQTLTRSYFSGVIREAMQDRSALQGFERQVQEAQIGEFKELDDFKLLYNRALVRLTHQGRLPTFSSVATGNLKTLMLQCQLQRRHRPIRWIMGQSGEAIQRIKPVFMMSPLSVAVHLPSELPKFDLVIFDEASQIRPEDAMSAIARGKQTVVVGDTRQMPPTNFFTNLTSVEGGIDDDEVAEPGDQETQKLESILSLMSAVTTDRVRRPDLRWHYRSLHPSLIEPSNELFYERRLVVFPSPGPDFRGSKIGVVHRHLPSAVYQPGSGGRVNPEEAKAVAEAVLDHVRSTPKESLLIAAMNKPQSDLIYEHLSALEEADPAPFSSYRDLNPHEPLEVKNLENVQGDERDVVYISVTYGKDDKGVFRQQFGPLLLEGGERRLNVLITRARKRCEVFSSIRASDITADPSKAGIWALKTYLAFAETGEMDSGQLAHEGVVDTFQSQVAKFIEEKGYGVKTNVGFKNFHIDLGVVSAENPNRFILGIEGDGPAYHQARSARDRDKLRNQVLKNRGWNLHRIWIHDWWQDRPSEESRLLAAIESAPTWNKLAEPLVSPDMPFVEAEVPSLKPPQTRRYVAVENRTVDDSVESLTEFGLEVIQVEGPIVDGLLLLRLKQAAAIKRQTGTVEVKLAQVLANLGASGLHSADCFLSNPEQGFIPRNWMDRPPAERKAEFVADVEITSALRAVISASYGVDGDQAARSAFLLLGFKKSSETSLNRAKSIIDKAVKSGIFVLSPSMSLSVPSK